MNIQNNIYIPQNFTGMTVKKENKTVSMENALTKMIPQGNEVLIKKAEKEVPENGRFAPVVVTYKLPDSNNKVRVKIEHDEKEYQTQRRLSVGVHHENSDRLSSEYLKKGTKQEIITYLSEENTTKEMADAMIKLSKKTDDYYNSL